MKYDVIIIGAGVSGCAVARELSRYKVKACVLERAEDVCCGTSKANSGIVHAGHDAWPGTLMAQLNVRGNTMMEPLSEELDFEFKRNGSLVVCTDEGKRADLQKLLERGQKNGVEGLRILEREEAFAMEPNLAEETVAVLYAPTGGIVCPFGMNIALAENAFTNGIEFYFDTEVSTITKLDAGFLLDTSGGCYEAAYVVNAAGVYADVFHNMVSKETIKITPRRGEYMLLDKTAGGHVSHTVFRLPDDLGKGVLVTPTVHGNLMVGPTAQNLDEREAVNTTQEGLQTIRDKAGQSVKDIPFRQVITSFAGLRACEQKHDFIIGEAEDAPGFIDCAGIASPGLTSAPAIGEMIAEILKERMHLQENPGFCGKRKGILNPAVLSMEERNALIEKEPAYGNIICRCEMVTEGEILDAVRRPLGARSLDGVKRRTRAGMGRCQAGFCSPRTMEILTRECGMPMEAVTKSGGDSVLICGTNKDKWQGDK